MLHISMYTFVYVLSFSGAWRLQDKICRLETVESVLISDVNLVQSRSFISTLFDTFLPKQLCVI